MNQRGRRNDALQPDPDYTPQQAITSISVLPPRGREPNGQLQVMFSPWHHNRQYYNYEAYRQVAMGTTVLTIVSHPQVLEPDAKRVLQSYDYLSERAANEIGRRRGHFDTVRLFAASSGNIALSRVASLQPDWFHGATMLAAGDNVASCIWFGSRTADLRSALTSEGYDFNRLNELWAPLASSNHVAAFRDKPVTFVRSVYDANVPPHSQLAYCLELREAGAQLDERVSHLGHYLTIARALRCGVGGTAEHSI